MIYFYLVIILLSYTYVTHATVTVPTKYTSKNHQSSIMYTDKGSIHKYSYMK